MFTGLIEELGRVEQARDVPEGRRVVIQAPRVADGMVPGDSVAVNGVCLTAERLPAPGSLEAVVVGETLRRTTLAALRPGSKVNLERALRMGDRMGGHMVNGHVDAVSRILAVRRQGNDLSVDVSLAPELAPYLVEKGSIAVDGVSLTVGEVAAGRFRVHIIPSTWERTLIGAYRAGDRVNLEVDVLAKYVERMLAAGAGRTRREPSWATALEEEEMHEPRE